MIIVLLRADFSIKWKSSCSVKVKTVGSSRKTVTRHCRAERINLKIDHDDSTIAKLEFLFHHYYIGPPDMNLPALPRNDMLNVFFVSHAGCHNRGCEAILRSLESYLLDHYGPHNLLVSARFPEAEENYLADLSNLTLVPQVPPEYSVRGVGVRCLRRLGLPSAASRLRFRHLYPCYEWADAVIEIGGDRFAMHYGGPWDPLEQVRLGKVFGRPTAIEGASIGPFTPRAFEAARAAFEGLDVICARDTISYEYLVEMGLTNAELVADPAFLMPPQPIEGLAWPDDLPVLGIGLSAGFPAYLGIDSSRYISDSIEMIQALLDRTDARVALIPHVFKSPHAEDDFQMCAAAAVPFVSDPRLWTLPHQAFSAMQLKYIIGRCDVFASARMHATIAALSQEVPTLAFTYSRKSGALFQDIYGHTDFVLKAETIGDGRAADVIEDVWTRRDAVRASLAEGVSKMKARSRKNGEHCVRLLRSSPRARSAES